MANWNLPETYTFDSRPVRYGVTGDGPPLVILHGTPWSSFNMRHLINALSRDFTVYYHDLIGYGQSDMRPGDVSLGIQNRILDELIDHWGLNAPPIIGHDFGGATVLRTHLLNGRAFEKIVLIDPVSLSPWGSPFFQHVKKHEEAFSGVPDYIHEAIVRAYIKTAAFKPLNEEPMNMTVSPWTGADGKSAFYRQIAQANSKFTEEVQSSYSRISRPVLILWGKEDTWIPLDRGRQLHEMIPNSQFHIIPDSGHLVIEEHPELLVDKIRPFLLNEQFT
jgi:pimeloyl-ACP methyl ester carboxylesterase